MSPDLLATMSGGTDDLPSNEAPRLPLPVYLIEERSWGSGSWGLFDSGYWDHANTAPMLHVDIRSYASPQAAAQDVTARARLYIDGARGTGEWPATKPDAWAFYVDGFDAPVSTNAQKFLRHPADELVAGQGVGGGSGSMTMYPVTGYAQGAAYFAAFLAELESERIAQSLPHPLAALEDTEAVGDVYGRSFAGAFFGPVGVFEAALAHARASTYSIDGSRTLNQWMAQRTTRPDGTAYPSYPQTTNNPNHPDNFDQAQRAFSAFLTCYYYHWTLAFFGPARALWPNCRTGSWGYWGNSRARRVTQWPTLRAYDVAGYIGSATDGIVPNYSAPHPTQASAFGDAREPTLPNWCSLESLVYNAGDILLPGKAGAKVIARRAAEMSGVHRLMPAIQLGFSTADRPAMISGLLNSCNAGNVSHVYVFCPDIASNATNRAAYSALIAEANAAFLATGRYV